jgi:DHA3 family macrolide efflux protein-like MFS transporter
LEASDSFFFSEKTKKCLIHIILLGSPLDYTLFVAGFPAGAMFGSILFSRIKIKTSLLTGLLIAPVGGILSTIALSRSPSLDPVLTLLTGLFVVLANIGLESIFIKLIPDAVMGKVNSFAAIFLIGGSPVMGALFDFLSRIILIHYIITSSFDPQRITG